MNFMERIQDTLNKGLDSSKEMFARAREKAVDLGDKGVLKFEILQLENQAEKLVGKLGTVVYKSLTEGEDRTVSENTPEVKELLDEIQDVKRRVAEKEVLLKKYE